MAVALRDLDRGRRPDLRLVPTPLQTPRGVFWLRRALVVLIAVIAVLAVTAGMRVASGAETGDTARLEMTVILPAGQTLWDLAGRYAPDGGDRSMWVQQVATRNDLDPRAILPGTPLLIPIESAAITADPQEPSRR